MHDLAALRRIPAGVALAYFVHLAVVIAGVELGPKFPAIHPSRVPGGAPVRKRGVGRRAAEVCRNRVVYHLDRDIRVALKRLLRLRCIYVVIKRHIYRVQIECERGAAFYVLIHGKMPGEDIFIIRVCPSVVPVNE